MTADRYDVLCTETGYYVFDKQDNIPVDGPYMDLIEAEARVSKMNRRSRTRIREAMLDAYRDSSRTRSGVGLEDLISQLGAVAKTRGVDREAALMGLFILTGSWLEEMDANR
jgi:hypothetical protein